VIIHLPRFIERERPLWDELERMLDRLDNDAGARPDLREALRLHYLYQRIAADLSEVRTFAAEPRLQAYLEGLAARAYQEIHESRAAHRRGWLAPLLLVQFPAVFRKHFGAFLLALAVMLAGGLFGGIATGADPEAKEAFVPPQFAHLLQDPAARVREEEESRGKELRGMQARFSSQLMTHNIRVSIGVMALGMTWGIGTIVLLFYNGVILGFVAADYLMAGQTVFLLAWLLPHGVIEIPAILVGGQAGFVLAGAIIGRGSPLPFGKRMRSAARDVCVLVAGLAAMLIWAGLVEAFISQHHQPVIPYAAKIGFGVLELALLAIWLTRKPGGKAAGTAP
jgi:uncharacterized membrane protein SpoIIM required for sporulation